LKGVAFLWARTDRRDALRPLVMARSAATDRASASVRLDEHDIKRRGSIPAAIRFVASLDAEGWPGIMAANRSLAIAARDRLAARLEVDPPAPDTMLGAMAALPIPDLAGATDEAAAELQADLLGSGYEVPIMSWPVRAARPDAGQADDAGPSRAALPAATLIRISAQRYNVLTEYERLAEALVGALARRGRV
jgi:isopenicillin-N epimerase